MATSVRAAASEGAPAPGSPARSPSPWGPIAALVAVGLVIAVHVALMAPLRAPVIHPDELGYVQNARYLARGGLRPTTEYYPGYSLLLVPLWWLSRDPLTVWRGALIVNAALAGLSAVLAWRLLARLAPDLDTRARGLVVTATIAYPALLLFGDFSMSETAFATAFLGAALLAARAFAVTSDGGRAATGRAWPAWGALGVGCGLLALVHPRGYAVSIAAALVGVAVLAPRGRRAVASLAALAAGLLGGFVVTRVLVTTLKDPASRFSAYSPGGILSRAASVHGLLNLLSEAGGQLFYLSVATLGLVPFGLWVALRSLRACVRGDRQPVVVLRAFVGLAFLGVWAVSSLFMNLGTRADKLIYGRYNDGAVAPLLLLALAEIVHPLAAGASLRRARLRAVASWAAVGATALVASAAFTGLGHPGSEVHGPLNPVNVIAIVPYIRHFDGKVEVLALLGVGLAGLVALGVLALRWPAIAVGALAVGFAVLAVRTQATYILPGSRARAGQNAVPLALAAMRAGTAADLTCVGWDNAAADDFALYNTEFLLPAQRIRPFGKGIGGPCGPLVVSPDARFAGRYPGARMVTADPFAQVALWALPGTPTEAALASAGWLFPAGEPTALPTEARTASLQLPAAPVVVRSGAAVTVRVTAVHPPGGGPWPDLLTFPLGRLAVRLSAQWEGAGGTATGCPALPGASSAPLACQSADLPRVLLPGASATIPVVLRAVSATGQPLPPGTYTVRVGLYQELVGVFAGSGAADLEVHVTS